MRHPKLAGHMARPPRPDFEDTGQLEPAANTQAGDFLSAALDFIGALGFIAVAAGFFIGLHQNDYNDLLAAIASLIVAFLVVIPYFVAAVALKLARQATNTLYRVEWWLNFIARQQYDDATSEN